MFPSRVKEDALYSIVSKVGQHHSTSIHNCRIGIVEAVIGSYAGANSSTVPQLGSNRRQALCFEARKVEHRFAGGSTEAPSVKITEMTHHDTLWRHAMECYSLFAFVCSI